MDARTCSLLGDFLRHVEDLGLRAYDDLVIQNASDISRESDRIRVQKNQILLRESRAPDQSTRLGFMTMPFPQDRGPSLGFSVRSQSLHSVQDQEQNHWDLDHREQNLWDQHSLRKQPPPKPRRDPGTKLSTSDADGPLDGPLEAPLDGLVLEKQPPPKPRRNPDTHLSGRSGLGLDNEEPVYIEMGPNQNPDSDQDQEGVYEEMSFTSDSKPRAVPTPFPNLLSHRPPLLTLPPQTQTQTQTQAAGWTSPHTSDESPLTPLEKALGQFFDSRSKPQKNPGFKPEPRVRRTSDPVQNQDSERGLFKSDRRPEWSQSVDQIHPERGQRRGTRTAAEPRHRRLDSEPDLRPDQRRYYSLRRDPTGRDPTPRDPRKGLRAEQRRERSLESLERVLDQDQDQDFTVTSSGRASAPPLSRSGPSPVPQSYRRSQSACPSPVKRPPPYEVIMMSAATSHGGHVTRLRGSSAPGPESAIHIPNQELAHSQGAWFFGGVSLCGAPGSAPGVGPRLAAGDVLMMGTMERKRVLCREIRSRTSRKPPPYGATAPPTGRRGWDTEI